MSTASQKDYFWNTLGVLAQNAISPFLLIVITRLNGIYDSGLFSFAFSVAIAFWTMGIWGGRTYQVSDIRNEFSHRSYITARLILGIGMLLGAVIFSLINQYDGEKTGIIIALVLFKIAESVADAIYGVLQVHSRLFIAGRSLFYKAIGGFAAFYLVDLLTHNILIGAMAIVVVNLLIILFYDIRIAQKLEEITIRADKVVYYVKQAATILKQTAPVFAITFLATFSLNIPRYFIDKYHGDQIGYFGIIAMPITLIILVVTFVMQPNVLSLSRLFDQQEYRKFRNIIDKILGISLLAGLGILVTTFFIGVPALNIVFGIDFDPYKTPLLIMVVGGVASALVAVLMNVIVIMRHFKHLFYTLLITNISLVILSALAIQSGGIAMGASLFALVGIIQVVFGFLGYRVVVGRLMKLTTS